MLCYLNYTPSENKVEHHKTLWHCLNYRHFWNQPNLMTHKSLELYPADHKHVVATSKEHNYIMPGFSYCEWPKIAPLVKTSIELNKLYDEI